MTTSRALPTGQDWLITAMENASYNPDKAGVCFGVACMAMQAMLTRDFERFNNRLFKIYQTLDVTQQIDIDIRALFDGIEICQYPARNVEAMGELIRRQDAQASLALVLSSQLESQGGLIEVAKGITLYTAEQFQTYWKIWKDAFADGDFPVCFLLGSPLHIIAIGYDPQEKHWLFVDANTLPGQVIKTEQVLVEKIRSAFTITEGVSDIRTMLHMRMFVAKDNTEVTRQRLGVVKQPNWDLTSTELQEYTCNGYSPLDLAIMENDEEAVKDLLGRGLLPEGLLHAVSWGYISIAQRLLEAGDASINCMVGKGETLLYIAVQNQDYNMAALLLEYHADYQLCLSGAFPLLAAIQNNDAIMVQLLLNQGANVNQQSPSGEIALSIAVAKGYLNITELLLDWGVNLHTLTPACLADLLFVAVDQNYISLAEKLLAQGVDPTLCESGDAIVQLAASKGYTDLSMRLSAIFSQKDTEIDRLFLGLDGGMPYPFADARFLLFTPPVSPIPYKRQLNIADEEGFQEDKRRKPMDREESEDFSAEALLYDAPLSDMLESISRSTPGATR
ncbi:MAG TPA: ankyrin repeat domain-containing protein [Gammaproteobacteria bacterium]|nr:ankyrin repeat domain-containing protein [Gammaproteobacteria bacterium]